MKHLILTVLALLTLSAPALAGDKGKESAYDRVMRTQTIRCGYAPWPPYFDLDPNTGTLTGLSKDLSDAAANLLNLKLDYIQVVVGQEALDLRSGRIDAMCGTGAWVLSSYNVVSYSFPLFYLPVYVYIRQDENRFAKLNDLNTETVTFAGLDGDTSIDLAQRNFPKAKIQSLPGNTDLSQILMNVTTKKADVVIMDAMATVNFIKNNGTLLKPLGDKPLAVYSGGFSVAKGENDLLETLNGASEAALNLGITNPIIDRYDPDHKHFLYVRPRYEVSK